MSINKGDWISFTHKGNLCVDVVIYKWKATSVKDERYATMQHGIITIGMVHEVRKEDSQ